jgi:hypothetical protein
MGGRKHLHHIVPRHMGGTDDTSNLYECSIEQHAELHLALYLEHGHWQDFLAYHGLSGIASHEECLDWITEETKRKQSVSTKQYHETAEGLARRQRLADRNRKVKSEQIKLAWEEGKFANRPKPTGRPPGIKETKPRNRNYGK